jgi:hypothetical protein
MKQVAGFNYPSEMHDKFIILTERIFRNDRLWIIILLTYLTWQLPSLPHRYRCGFLMELGTEECWQGIKKEFPFFPSTRNLSLDHLF